MLTHCNMTTKGKFATLSLGCLYVLTHYDMKTKVELGYNINLGMPVLINCNMATKGDLGASVIAKCKSKRREA